MWKATILFNVWSSESGIANFYRGADKSLARPGMKQATATEGLDVHISYLLS